MVSASSSILAGCIAASAVALVEAHGNVKVPKAEFLPGKPTVEWVVTLKPAWPWEGPGTWAGGDQAGQYAKLSKKNGYSTLRSFLEDKGAKCGYTNDKASPKPIPSDGFVVFQGNGGTGFTHQGPCEVWLDDKMVFHNDNCEKAYAGKGFTESKLPVDFSSCTKNCMLRFYWLGFQNMDWQVYKNCVPLIGTGKAASSGSALAPSPAPKTKAPEAKAPSNKAPATNTEAPAKDSDGGKASKKAGCKRRIRN